MLSGKEKARIEARRELLLAAGRSLMSFGLIFVLLSPRSLLVSPVARGRVCVPIGTAFFVFVFVVGPAFLFFCLAGVLSCSALFWLFDVAFVVAFFFFFVVGVYGFFV